ncbi:MAG TPA: hypothetical protein VFU39_04205, partial [Sulfuricaulis sp.]|nr:hypothetical protein [Sulfuricaulis sp.]
LTHIVQLGGFDNGGDEFHVALLWIRYIFIWFCRGRSVTDKIARTLPLPAAQRSGIIQNPGYS